MKLKKITFWSSLIILPLIFFFFIGFLILKTFAPAKDSSTVIPIHSSITSSSEASSASAPVLGPSGLDITLHSKTQDLLNTPAYNTVIDKSADFSSVTIYLDGTQLTITDKPFKYKGRLYLPLRQVGEALGIKIDFNGEYKVALAQSDTYRLEMPLKYTKAIKIPLSHPEITSTITIDTFNPDVSSVFYKEKTYLPVRFTAESLGFAVKYEEKENAVYFTSPQSPNN